MRKLYFWKLKQREIKLGERTAILGVLNLTMGKGGGHVGPTRGSIVRGFFAQASDPVVARAVLADWAKTSEPSPELWDWLAGKKYQP